MQKKKHAVLLVNLGTPNEPTSSAVKCYLKEFLSDSRVIDISPMIWQPILNSVILPWRSPQVARLYQSIWMKEGSPLLVYSKRQQDALSERLPNALIELGMSYGSPDLKTAIKTLLDQDIHSLVVLPLYPQHSCSTSAVVWDRLRHLLKDYHRLPSIRFIRDYATHPAYIFALKKSVERSLDEHGSPDRLILSFHGIPKRYAFLGDDYPQRCEDTRRALTENLRLSPERVIISYQSRLNHEPWLTPYTEEILRILPKKGVKHVQLICPGFSVDCLETLQEIKMQHCEIFIKSGGKKFEYIPALNDDSEHIDMMQELVTKLT